VLDTDAGNGYTAGMQYTGGKNGSGVYQRLINLIPPHTLYVEAFLGSGPIMRFKRPAVSSVGIDADGEALSTFPSGDIPNLMLIKTDAVDWLSRNPLPPDAFVYLDPPYLMSTRSTKQDYYKCEFGDDAQHTQLLQVATGLKCMVMISGYYSELYARMLNGWRTVTFKSRTRSGRTATEWVWMNYPEPFALHDYTYLGEDRRKRQNIRKMQKRQLAKLRDLPTMQRYAMLEVIKEWEASATPQLAAVPAVAAADLAAQAADTIRTAAINDAAHVGDARNAAAIATP
jgi:DNA adenine methylase